MKLSQSTTILANVILILAIAFLLKSIFIFPKDLQAQRNYAKYKVIQLKDSVEQIEKDLNENANEGWKLYYIAHLGFSLPIAVLER